MLMFWKTLTAGIRPWIRHIEVHPAVGYLLATRLWQCVSFSVMFVLLQRTFSKTEIGYYQLMNAWLAMQVIAELGLPFIVMVFASHEWGHLRFDEQGSATGDARAISRLASLDRFTRRWFGVAAVIFLLAVGGAGLLWLGDRHDDIAWRGPWLAAIAANAVSLSLVPRISLLEGCNQLVAINRMRLFAAVSGSVLVWTCLLGGAGLWFLPLSNLLRVGWELQLVQGHFGRFFRELRSVATSVPLSFTEELWPLQWRGAVQNVSSYFSSSFLVLVVDAIRNKSATGQMGLTWQVLGLLRDVSFAFIQTRMPQLGSLAATGDRQQLTRLWRRAGWLGVLVFIAGNASFCAFVLILARWWPQYAEMFLPLDQILLLMSGLLGLLVASVLQTYVRVHKKDPFVWVNTLTSLGVGLVSWQLGLRYEVWGVVFAYAAVTVGFMLPASWWYWKRLRDAQNSPPLPSAN